MTKETCCSCKHTCWDDNQSFHICLLADPEKRVKVDLDKGHCDKWKIMDVLRGPK
jgi:hypothetical protein